MAQIWSAVINRPPSVPISQVHVMLYSYFPGAGLSERPYTWRLLAHDKIGLISAQKPTTQNVRHHVIEAGHTYNFLLTYKRVRTTNKNRYVTINSMVELRDRMLRFVSERGGEVGYVRHDNMRDLVIRKPDKKITIPIVDAVGTIFVTDPDLCVNLMTSGGPGTGKAFGCGAWWIPELMEDHA